MHCTCVRHTDLPNTSKLFADLIYSFDRVRDLYPWAPNDLDQVVKASALDFPDERRARLVEALRPLNPDNPSLDILAKPGVVAIVTGHMAKGEIARSNGTLGGGGLATAGLVLGYIGVGLTVLGICVFGVAFALPLCLAVLASFSSSNTHSMLLPWLLAA